MATAELVVEVVTKMAGNGLADAEKQTGKFQNTVSKASKVAGVALLGIGAAALSAADAAAEDAQSQAMLANAMQNAAGASKSQIAATEDWISAQSAATGVADDELRPALAQLVRATGDVGKSQKLLGLAMDISAGSGKSLQSVTAALVKAQNGSLGGLSKLGVATKDAAGNTKTLHQVTEELANTYKGAAAKNAKTAAGQMQIFKLSLQETQEAAGQALLPALEALTKILVPLGAWAQSHGTMFTVIAGGVAILAAAIIALNVALKIYNTITAITAVVSKAAWLSTLGPILLIVAAVLAVVAVVVILWQKFPPFRNAVLACWNAIKAGAAGVWAAIQRIGSIAAGVFNWIRGHWKLIAAILGGPFVAAAIVIINNWGKIKSTASAVLTWLKTAVRTAVSAVKGIFEEIWTKARDVFTNVKTGWGKLTGAIKLPAGLADTLKAPFTAMHDAITAVGTAIADLVRKIAGIHFPKPPGWLSKVMPGSWAATPAVAGLGAAPAVAMPGATAARSGGAGGGVTVNIYGAVDPESTARQVRRILAGHDRRVGLRIT